MDYYCVGVMLPECKWTYLELMQPLLRRQGDVYELSEQSGAFGWSAACQRGLASHHPGLETLGLSWEQRWSRERGGELPLLVEVVYVAVIKRVISGSKTRKVELLSSWEVLIIFQRVKGWPTVVSICKCPGHQNSPFHQIKQWSTADPWTTQGLGTLTLWARQKSV